MSDIAPEVLLRWMQRGLESQYWPLGSTWHRCRGEYFEENGNYNGSFKDFMECVVKTADKIIEYNECYMYYNSLRLTENEDDAFTIIAFYDQELACDNMVETFEIISDEVYDNSDNAKYVRSLKEDISKLKSKVNELVFIIKNERAEKEVKRNRYTIIREILRLQTEYSQDLMRIPRDQKMRDWLTNRENNELYLKYNDQWKTLLEELKILGLKSHPSIVKFNDCTGSHGINYQVAEPCVIYERDFIFE